MNHRPIQGAEVEKFQSALNQAVASLAAARAIYSSILLTPEQIQSPGASNDRGYINLTNAGPAIEMGGNQCMAAIFEQAQADAVEAEREKATKPQIVKMMPGGMVPN